VSLGLLRPFRPLGVLGVADRPAEAPSICSSATQFGEAVPGVSVTVTGHAFSTNALTDAHGSATITLAAGHGSLHVSLSAPTYRTLTTLIN
jgi:hypothetical protein